MEFIEIGDLKKGTLFPYVSMPLTVKVKLADEPGGMIIMILEKLNIPPLATTIFPIRIACGLVVSNLAIALSSPDKS